MTEEKYFELLETLNKLGDQKINLMGTSEYEEVARVYDTISEMVTSYEEKTLKELIDKNLSSDIDTCMEMLNLLESYSIGSHICGMNNHIMSDPSKLSESILTKGLISARREGGGILENVHMLGSEHVMLNLQNMLVSFYSRAISASSGGVVVAIPASLIDANFQRQYIGKFPSDLDFISKDDYRVSNLPINILVQKIGYLPPEFILGVVARNEKGEICFNKNERFISLLSLDEQIEVYNRFVSQGLVPITDPETIYFAM